MSGGVGESCGKLKSQETLLLLLGVEGSVEHEDCFDVCQFSVSVDSSTYNSKCSECT